MRNLEVATTALYMKSRALYERSQSNHHGILHEVTSRIYSDTHDADKTTSGIENVEN